MVSSINNTAKTEKNNRSEFFRRSGWKLLWYKKSSEDYLGQKYSRMDQEKFIEDSL